MTEKLDEMFRTRFGGMELNPSVRFGLDSALLMSLSLMKGISLQNLYSCSNSSTSKTVSVNALLDTTKSEETVMESCRTVVKKGYRTVKIKVGRNPDVLKEADIVNRIGQEFGDQLKIRLDANRAWNLEDALSFAARLDPELPLEYIEEPVNDFNQLNEFHSVTNLPLALDESLTHLQSTELAPLLKSCKGVVCCVLKPSQFGSLDALVQMMETCVSAKCSVVITSAFETPVGLSTLACLAAISNDISKFKNLSVDNELGHGLGTLNWIECKDFNGDMSFLEKSTLCLDACWGFLKTFSQRKT